MRLDEIRPFGDRLLVRPDPRPEMAGSLHIPQTVRADNPNWYGMTGVVVRLGDGVREDVYECCNRQCRYQSRRTVGERCMVCGASQFLAYADSGVHQFDLSVGDRIVFNRYAGKQIEVEIGRVDILHGAGSLGLIVETGCEYDVPVILKFLMMREVEVFGVLDGNEQVLPGYQPPSWNKPTKGLTPVQDIG